MRIKQIELNGFKSFMQRTPLEFPPGVTAIVGPNGCGKSNVVDAIRWVLGEQSPKHLRGAAMEDVVFGGNAQQGPLGMAEVSLLLERDAGDLQGETDECAEPALGSGLPPELANASEIVVTRRYFRSGESEYFINRAPCRLKDITELFLGTGVGTKAYAIIEQGRVDQLVNAKPEELRLFLEEAAGTTRFRSRRLAAERKMERTRENLMRVRDVLHEIERQRASLERQARRAEEYRRVKDELRELDLRVMASRSRRATTALTRLEERLREIRDEEARLHEHLERSRGATSEARTLRAAREQRLRSVEEQIVARRLLGAESRARAENLTVRSRDMSAATAAAGSEMERLEGRQAGLVGEIAALAAEEERLAGEQPAAEGARTQAERYLQAVGAAGPPLEEAVETARDGLVEALNEEARARNLVEALSRRREDLSGRRQKLTDEQGTLGERLVANGRAIEAADLALRRLDDERDTLVHAREGAARERGEVAASQRVQSDRLLALQAEVTELRSRAASLRTLHERHEGCALGATRLLGRKDPNAVLLASVLRVPEELERAVAAALGTRLAHVVVADTTGALDAVRWLWQTDGGRATVLPRDSGRRRPTIVPTGRRLVDLIEVDTGHWALAEALLGDVVLADDLEAALDVWHRAPHAVTAVTRRGEAIDALGAVSGGSDPPIEETMLARARELRELEDGVAALSAHVAAAERALAETADRLRQSAERVEVLDRRAQEIRVERVGADKDREGLEAERERIKAALEVAALEASGLAGEDGQMADELCVLRERLVRLQDAVGGRRAALSECQRRLARWHEEQRAAEGAHTAAAVHAAAVVERLRAARAELERCRTTLGENQDRLAVVRRQESETSVAAQEALREAGMAAATAADAEREAEALEQERTTILVAIAEADALLTRDDTTERTVSERLEAAREERSRFEVASAEHRMHLDNLATQLTERYGLEPSTLDGVAVEEDGADEERAARADALRGRLARLGDVNPTAIEELDELRSRHEFLSAQRDDLERSLEDLRRTIAKLVRTSRERFAQTFTAVNEKLAEVFPKLFPGGRARLELRELEDAEEPGVEIVVQPAGKKLQTLSLLSGGEKALTAVTLILALFLTRPTPFCLLDEVDAPLDEANIGRFNQVIRELSTRSQFVLITHNRRTMEAADTLYGITMEQAGVSKVVSVRLRDAA